MARLIIMIANAVLRCAADDKFANILPAEREK